MRAGSTPSERASASPAAASIGTSRSSASSQVAKTASPAKRKINLSWSASTDNVGVTGYQIWRSSSPSGPFTQIATTTGTTYTNGGLTSGSTWSYQIKAFDQAGNVSAASNTATATAR